MYTLPVSQCPKCVLRFGSSSELDQHLRQDHRSSPRSRQQPTVAPAEETDDRPTRVHEVVRLHRFVVRAIIAAAILAFVAAISWPVAALLTLFLVAGVGGWALRRAER